MVIYDKDYLTHEECEMLEKILKNPEDDSRKILLLLEKKIKESEDKYRSLLEGLTSVGIGIDIVNKDYKILFQNKMLRMRFGDISGECCYEKYMEFEQPCKFCPMVTAIKNNKVERVELTAADGRDYELISAPLPNPDGTIDKAAEVVLDITDRNKNILALKESETRYRNVVDNAANIIICLSKNYELIEFNRKAEKLYGFKREEVIGKNYLQLFIPESFREEVAEDIQKVLSGEDTKDFENPIITKEGSNFMIRWNVSRLDDVNHETIGVIAIGQDITERKKAQEKLKESEEKYRNLLNNIHESVFELDEKGNIIYISPQVYDITGYKPEEQIGANLVELIHPDDLELVSTLFNKLLQSGEIQSVEFRRKHKDGHYIYVNSSGRRIKIGDKYKIIGTTKDITERKKAQEKLKESEKKIREAYNKAEFYKDLFAHDINNILQIIQSAKDLLELYKEQPDKIKVYQDVVEIINAQVARGALLVSNIRKLSQLDESEVLTESIEINEVLNDVVTSIKNSFREKDIDIQIDSNDTKVYVLANQFLLDVFENILINAVKYNNNQIIEVLIKISRDLRNNRNFAKIEVIDNGTGIEDSRKEKIFQRGYSDQKSTNGIGLGLSLVRKIINIYEGYIWVEDRVKKDHSRGSNFIILIPEVN